MSTGWTTVRPVRALPLLSVLTTNQKGVLAEAAVMLEATKLGVGVVLPLGDERYDLILDIRPTLLRVQCKWAVRHGDVVVIRTRTRRRSREGLIHRSYDAGEIDLIAAYCAEMDNCYLLPPSLSCGRAAIQLRLSATRNNQQERIHWARDFGFAATLKRLYGPIAQLGERQSGRL